MMADAYRTPAAEPLPEPPDNRKRGRGMAVSGLCLLGAGLIGIILSVLWVIREFRTLASSGTADPDRLAAAISDAFVPLGIGLVLSLVGAVVCCMVVYGNGNRERWFSSTALFLSVPLFTAFPVGTLVAAVLVFGLMKHRRQFLGRKTPQEGDQA